MKSNQLLFVSKTNHLGRVFSYFLTIFLILSLITSNKVVACSNAHGKIPHVDIDVLSRAKNPTTLPAQLGPSSIKLLQSDINLESGYGRGWYYANPQNAEENLVNQGFAMYNMFQYTDSFRSFNTALKLNPNLTIAYIGRALNALSLDQSNQYYLVEAYEQIMAAKGKGLLDAKTLGWVDLVLVMITGYESSGQKLDIQTAYNNLKIVDPDNLEVITAMNWVANIYNLDDFDKALAKDPQNVGALHYLMHIAEGRNDHSEALMFGQLLVPLVPKSAHGQHMLGHVLPHFNRWAEADSQFKIADQLHLDWSKQNKVPASEDWHYGHNLQLFSVTKMVVDPANAVSVLKEIETINPGAIIDTLDYLIATTNLGQKTGLENYLIEVEGYSTEYKNYVQSSRLFFDLIFKASDDDVVSKIAASLGSMSNFKNKNFLKFATSFIQALRSNDSSLQTQILNRLIGQLNANFSKGGFDGWQQSVIETLMYKKVFEIYGSTDGLYRMQKEIVDMYMKPIS